MLFGLGGGGGAVDRLQIRDYGPAQLPGYVVERSPHQMHDAELHFGTGIDRLNGFGKTFQPVHAGDEDIFHPAVLQLGAPATRTSLLPSAPPTTPALPSAPP